jgi:protein-L-isoaspartate(D-aspartate) O-methyltransferase
MKIQRHLETATVFAVGLAIAGSQCTSAPESALAPLQVDFDQARKRMVQAQIRARGVENVRVLEAMGAVPRHEFVPEAYRGMAYEDMPLPTSLGQTISQPYIVALMTELIDPKPEHRVLEVGTGSGYQAAILSKLVHEIYTIEILPELARTAAQRLERLDFKNVRVREGDGYQGWTEFAPFDSILVTAAAPELPKPLVDQLKRGGRMVIPVDTSDGYQILQVIEKDMDGMIRTRNVIPVRFVPLLRK